MDFDSINYFLSVCTSGSLSEAAKNLYISQPTLSRRITALEGEIGVELLYRSSTGITLTPAGKMFYEEQSRLMYEQHKLMDKMRTFQGEFSGTLNIGVRKGLPAVPVIQAAKIARGKNPHVEIRILEYDIEDLAERYATGRLDLVYSLRDYLREYYSGEIDTLVRISPTLLIPEGHRLYDAEQVNVSDLVGEKFTILKRGTGMQKYAINLLEKHGVSFKDAYVCDSAVNRLSAAIIEGRLAIGSSSQASYYDSLLAFFRSVVIPSPNVEGVDICIAYQSSNPLAVRFANLMRTIALESENENIDTLVIE